MSQAIVFHFLCGDFEFSVKIAGGPCHLPVYPLFPVKGPIHRLGGRYVTFGFLEMSNHTDECVAIGGSLSLSHCDLLATFRDRAHELILRAAMPSPTLLPTRANNPWCAWVCGYTRRMGWTFPSIQLDIPAGLVGQDTCVYTNNLKHVFR